jgi:hypothetical protein
MRGGFVLGIIHRLHNATAKKKLQRRFTVASAK